MPSVGFHPQIKPLHSQTFLDLIETLSSEVRHPEQFTLSLLDQFTDEDDIVVR